ncbi:FxsA family protein [Halonatronum saccharophilum]|uniref:FxsA family protein n=1 Tax=Halonatronum saccharophilum TaxID=150060 RepID=UPI0004B62F5D|nr:FxsA family protein [Halonatronum saccharophilum]
MFFKLLLLFTAVPIIELIILMWLSAHIGIFETVTLIFITGVVGVTLAKAQGFITITKIKLSLARAKLPSDSLIDGLLILIGGAFLLTPGLLTDVSGFSLIIPVSRGFFRKVLKNKFKGKIIQGGSKFYYYGGGDTKQGGEGDDWEDLSESIDVEFDEVD